MNTSTDHTLDRALRFLTAGSVDDGKSTLIGRLLLDSKAILADQWHVLQKRASGGAPDLSLLTDGLEAEREQGITIDVAYRYFATPARKFIIADAPGHEQYTRNMVTAAAGSDAAVILVDITKLDLQQEQVALLPQTRRHTLLAHLLRVPSLVFAVNKLDAVQNPHAAFVKTSQALQRFCEQSGVRYAGIIPISALRGDNVVEAGFADWYQGPSLLEQLHELPSVDENEYGPALLPVQWVQRQGSGIGEQPRVFWGRVARGSIQVGDSLQGVPNGEIATVSAIRRTNPHVPPQSGQSIGIVLDRQLDVSRGDWLVSPRSVATHHRFRATLAWLDTEPAIVGRKYLLRHANAWVTARITAIESRLDIHSLQRLESHQLSANDIGDVIVEVQQPLPLLPYQQSRIAGAAILVDPASHHTSAAALVRDVL